MARGFDTKSVSDQQDELQRRREAQGTQKRVVSPRRRQLELARVDLVRRLEASTDERYRASLQGALEAVDAQLKDEPPDEDPR
jgi:hypothetical protein